MNKHKTKFKLYGSMAMLPQKTRTEYKDQLHRLSVDPHGIFPGIIQILPPLKRTLIWSTN
jgi:hypothetical protein